MSTLVWFRDDLRLADHPALHAAAELGEPIIAVYLLDEESPETRPLGGAVKWWLHESLQQLERDLASLGVPLILRRGCAEEVIPAFVRECAVSRVYWNRRYSSERAIDARLKEHFGAQGVEVRSFIGGLLFEPWNITTQTGGQFRVFTPFWRACLAAPQPPAPLPAPTQLTAATQQPVSEELVQWALQPEHPNWASEFSDRWNPGERAASVKLDAFLAGDVSRYAEDRNVPSIAATSELSPHLRFGEISPRTVFHRALNSGKDVRVFLSELGWREFAWHTLFTHGDLHTKGIDPKFDHFGWRPADSHTLRAWQRGETGFGMVDAGMRELWRTGFMHNRVRMIAASFLTKNLLVDWRVGEAWFWDTLVDADAASNPFSWQWVAGCGADAAPYFRVFNPETQQAKFDPEGSYVTRWAPDSAMLPQLVDLRETRVQALAAYDAARKAAVS